MLVGQRALACVLTMLAGEGRRGWACKPGRGLGRLAFAPVKRIVGALPGGSGRGQKLKAKGNEQADPAYRAGGQAPECAVGPVDEFKGAGSGGNGYGEECPMGAGRPGGAGHLASGPASRAATSR